MAKEKLKSLKTAFTAEGDYLAILSTDGTVKVWNTSNGTPLAEWKDSSGDLNVTVSCLACSFKGKKRRKEQSTCLVAVGTDGGDISVLNISSGQILWKSTEFHHGGTARLSFTKNGRRLYAVGTSGIVHEMNADTGEVTRELKISKKSISSAAFSPEDQKIVAAVGNRIRVFSLEDGKELQKFSSISGPAKFVSASSDAKFIVAAEFGEKQLQVWKCDFSTSTTSSGGLVLSMKHAPLFIECKNGCNREDGLVVLSVLETGVAYLWNLKSVSEEVNRTKITVKASSGETGLHKHGGSKKNRISIIAAKVHDLATDGQVRTLVAYGSVDSPQFILLDLTSPGEDIVIASGDETIKEVGSVQDNGVHVDKGVSKKKEKGKNKRDASDLDSLSEVALPQAANGDSNGVQADYDLNEPTMGEKLADLNLAENNEDMVLENQESSPLTKPPSADSVHVLLRQALHADDRALLVECLYRQEKKVVANSVAQLNPSEVLKFLQSLLHIIQSRGGVLACALPWLRSLLLQHASGIMSQESSLLVLNSLYQLIESRISTYNQAVKLSSSLDLLYAGDVDEGDEESDATMPFIYEDKDESDEDDAMDTESEEDEKEAENLSGVSDFEDME